MLNKNPSFRKETDFCYENVIYQFVEVKGEEELS